MFVTSPLIKKKHIILVFVSVDAIQQKVVLQIVAHQILQGDSSLLPNRLHFPLVDDLHNTLQLTIMLVDQLAYVRLAQLVRMKRMVPVEFFIVRRGALFTVLFDVSDEKRVVIGELFL